jgi:Flp pilus assembly protein TadG
LATAAAFVLVPLAGAAEPPQGWTVATFTALLMLLAAPMLGERAPWGWLGVALAVIGIVSPLGQFAALEPAIFVACGLCLVLWYANRPEPSRPATRRHPDPDARIRAARQSMGLLGERHVAMELERALPEAYVVINGIKLPRGAGDIDHLVIGPTGVFVLETKTMAGRIECNSDGNWTRTRFGRAGVPLPVYIGNPGLQVQRNIFGVRECLRAAVPNLFVGPALWIEGLVVFPHPRAELNTSLSRVPALRLEDTVSYICTHEPRRRLEPHEVDEIVEQLLRHGEEPMRPPLAMAQGAQALVEVAVLLPMLLGLALGIVALGRIVQAQTGVIALAHEAARAGALARTPDEAVASMRQRIDDVSSGVGLDARAVSLDWDVSTFGRENGRVAATVQYPVNLSDLPLLGWSPPVRVTAAHVEWVDPFRSGVGSTATPSP